MKITATIITLNEERNIARAIESLRCCDEILIVDSGSTDRTVELAQNLGARVIEAGWRGYAGAEKLGRRTGHPRLDPLARCRRSAQRGARSRNLEPEEIRPALRRLHHAAPGPLSGPLDSTTPAGIPTARSASTTAARPSGSATSCTRACRSTGRVGHLESNILHFTCDSLSEHLKTLDRYTTLAAQELAARKVARAALEPDLRSRLDFRARPTSSSAAFWTAWKA